MTTLPTKRAVLYRALLTGSMLLGCVASVRNNPDMALHFEGCVERENSLDERSGWRDREDSEIDKLCVAEARERKGQPVDGDRRTPEKRELDALWDDYERCSDFVPYQTKADIALCEAEISANIDAAKARHALRGEARAD